LDDGFVEFFFLFFGDGVGIAGFSGRLTVFVPVDGGGTGILGRGGFG